MFIVFGGVHDGKLHLSTYTIKDHIHNILEKLALHTQGVNCKIRTTSRDYNGVLKSISDIDE